MSNDCRCGQDQLSTKAEKKPNFVLDSLLKLSESIQSLSSEVIELEKVLKPVLVFRNLEEQPKGDPRGSVKKNRFRPPVELAENILAYADQVDYVSLKITQLLCELGI